MLPVFLLIQLGVRFPNAVGVRQVGASRIVSDTLVSLSVYGRERND